MLRPILAFVLLFLLVAVAVVFSSGKGWLGDHEGPGQPTAVARTASAVAAVADAQREAAEQAGVPRPKQILFGDLHVHTTLSFDAFMMSLPIAQGEGSHPQADACDFARFCSALDFWSINDHAEFITPRHWEETVSAIQQCNDVAGDPADPDTVAFLGWEWTQVGTTPDDHYGHKNVVLAHTEVERVSPRPIAAASVVRQALALEAGPFRIGALALSGGHSRFQDLARYFAERSGFEVCEPLTPPDQLPRNCFVAAETPGDLFEQLDAWGHESIVIPHGTTWGFYTPSGSTWDKQLSREMHDPERQTLVEIYSGHGNSEEYRDWRAVEFDADGAARCPVPRPDYEPRCWRAGEIVRGRCLAEGVGDAECEERAAAARAHAAAAGGQAHLTVPGYDPAEWLDAGQCRDCAEPAFNYRPGGAAQYIMALGNFEEPGDPQRFRFGFMASSDNHFARPGTGYKEVRRRGFTESARNRGSLGVGPFAQAEPETPQATSRAFDREGSGLTGFGLLELERQASFFLTGGLIAAHAEGRDRGAIWDAMQRREVYATTGPRTLLWFDLLNPPGSRGKTLPMGAEVEMSETPIFQVRAVGSFEQLPGCPEYASTSLGPARLEQVCKGECYHPSDRRRPITRIDVIRIRPQAHAGEPVAPLIEDPWLSLPCEPDPSGCTATFADPDYASMGRDTLYYVRAHESPAPGINAANVRCERDAGGNCIGIDLCGGAGRETDDCLAEHEPRAWSSPIFVDWKR
ncbi:MAG: DUF3604 domain-containing protein [Myxococcota bacterium]|nr:DUF3604 domain-containing protein [Myxococcota bacterium]